MNPNLPIRLALADDHVILRKGLAELIDDFGQMQVILQANNGQDLIRLLETAEVLPHICILDINMPLLNGYETAGIIRRQWKEIKVLALSMYDNEFNIIRMLRNGANGYILKGAEPSELEKAIREIHRNGFYHSELVTAHMLHRLMQPHGVDSEELTEKEIQFLAMCCSELTYKEIADRMNHSPRTIDGYRDSLFHKLNIKSRTGLVMYALKAGIAPLI
jgi:DNA-binding NarL/FixJ family response regulator